MGGRRAAIQEGEVVAIVLLYQGLCQRIKSFGQRPGVCGRGRGWPVCSLGAYMPGIRC